MKNYIVLVLIGLIVSICAKAAELHLRANTSHIPETGTPAKKYYDKAVGGDAAAQHNLAFCYATGEGGVVQDYAESVKWERMAAEQGNVSAQYALAYRYYSGEGVAQSYEEAVRWYEAAAGQGMADAEYKLGLCHEYGYGVAQNQDEALRWYEKAADRGYPQAMRGLGRIYAARGDKLKRLNGGGRLPKEEMPMGSSPSV